MTSAPRGHRILLVTYHFPPSTVAATFRPLRLARYLPEMGHKVWVLSATPNSYASGRMDWDLMRDIPSSVRVTRLPNPNILRLYERRKQGSSVEGCQALQPNPGQATCNSRPAMARRFRTFLAELAKFPDEDAPWAALSLLPALHIVVRNRIDLICSSGPPFCAHPIGLFLKMLTGRPWIAQYGNPWTGNPSISWDFPLFQALTSRLDLRIVRKADAIMVLDDILADCIRALGRDHDLYVQPNGYDPAHFSPTDLPGGRFTITYAGSLYNMHNPQVIYDALNIIERDQPDARADMRIVFAGSAESCEMARGAPSDIEFTGPLRHARLVDMLNDSHLLLDFLTAESNAKFTTSCKIYEYMAARRPVLAVTPEGPMADEVKRLNLGKVVPPDDPATVAQAILAFYSAYKSGVLRVPDSPGIKAYSAPALASEFLRIADASCFGGAWAPPDADVEADVTGRAR